MNDKNEAKSNINQIGEIPVDWVIGKVKYYYKLQTGFTPDTKNEEFYDNESGETWVTIADITNSGKYISDSSNKVSQLYIQQKKPMFTPKGSLLYSFKLTVGKRSFAEKDLYTNEAIASFIDTPTTNLDFLYYSSTLIENNAATNIYNAKLLNQELIKNAYIVFPPKDEQTLIANFLGKKCNNIDGIISDLERQIEILEKYKKSVITEAVTKGLNPDVEMKESRVKFFGKIPLKWEVKKVKYLLKSDATGIKVGPFGSALTNVVVNSDLGKYKVYGQANLIRNDFNFGDNYIDDKSFQKLINYEVRTNDILLSMMGTIGKCKVVPNNIEHGIMDSHIIKIRLNNEIISKYFEYVYADSSIVIEQLLLKSKGSIMNGLNSQIIKNILLPVPSLLEQKDIIIYLNKKCSEIDSIIVDKKNQLETINKYKNSLIYEYVTGKKRVSQGDVNE